MQSQLYELVKKNQPLFWSIDKKKLKDLDEAAVVETILNFGKLGDVKELFLTLGIKKVAKIFYTQISQKRNNYYPPVSHYFDKYFKRHVQKYS